MQQPPPPFCAGLRCFLAGFFNLLLEKYASLSKNNSPIRQPCSILCNTPMPTSSKLGRPALTADPHKTWVQTERAAHEAWAALIVQAPRAAALMHILVAHMGEQNAVVINQKTLAKLAKCSRDTVIRSLATLKEFNWIQVVKLNGPGTVSAYVVNDRIAWGEARDKKYLSVFSASVVADVEDQEALELENSARLRRIPALFSGEMQLPTGPGDEPPAQALLGGLEPDLPATVKK